MSDRVKQAVIDQLQDTRAMEMNVSRMLETMLKPTQTARDGSSKWDEVAELALEREGAIAAR